MSEPYWSALGAAAGGGGYTSGTINAATAASDLAWPAAAVGLSNLFYVTPAAGGGIRSIAAPAAGAGTRVTIYASGTQNLTIKNNSAGGPNVIYMVGNADLVLVPGEIIELVWDATNFWLEVARDRSTAIPRPSLGLVAQTITDWNNANENGWWMGSGAANAPTPTVWYIGQVTVHIQNLWMTQRVWDFTAAAVSQIYERRMQNGTWGAWYPIPAGYGTALPTGMFDGYEFTLVDSLAAPTYAWRFRYVSAKASNKWVFVGGSPLKAFVVTTDNVTSTTYAVVGTAGPVVTIPVAGDYIVNLGGRLRTNAQTVFMSYDIGATPAVDADATIAEFSSGSTVGNHVFRRVTKTFTAVTLTAKYRTTGGTNTVQDRLLEVTPIAVGG